MNTINLKCPACNSPYVSETGEWQRCRDCPFINPASASRSNHESDHNTDNDSKNAGNLPVLVLVKLSDLIELREQRDAAIREQAEMLFRIVDHED